MIKFSVGQLARQEVELDGQEPAAFLELTGSEIYEAVSPVKYHLHGMMIDSDQILIRGECSVMIKGICGRCLKEVTQTIVNREIELFFDEVDYQELDVSEDIRVEMLLVLPINILCSEDCRGLCPHCGCDLNVESCDCDAKQELVEGESDGGDDAENPWNALDNLKL